MTMITLKSGRQFAILDMEDLRHILDKANMTVVNAKTREQV
jgi:hypothetical protein